VVVFGWFWFLLTVSFNLARLTADQASYWVIMVVDNAYMKLGCGLLYNLLFLGL
jgi:hypothetical protein